jgi:hypothetical protein
VPGVAGQGDSRGGDGYGRGHSSAAFREAEM